MVWLHQESEAQVMMQRREFVKSSLMLGGAFACKRGTALQASDASSAADPQVKRVLVVFKCHFDAGFVNTQAAVVSRYFNEYFPQAIRVADQMRQADTQRYVWTTGSWLLYEYLEQASAEDRRRMERAISAGDIAWHALPFNWQTELMDNSMIAGSIALSHALDRRFDRTTTGAKLTDVPGHTRWPDRYGGSGGRYLSRYWSEWCEHACRSASVVCVERFKRS